MATIDDVYNFLQQNNPYTGTKYAISNDFVFNARAQFGMNGLRDAFEAIYNIQGNVNDIEAGQGNITTKVNEMYLAIVTADLAGKVNQLYASVHTEQLVNQLQPIVDQLTEALTRLEALGVPTDSYSNGSWTLFGLLNDFVVGVI